jgi:hypothetical protein
LLTTSFFLSKHLNLTFCPGYYASPVNYPQVVFTSNKGKNVSSSPLTDYGVKSAVVNGSKSLLDRGAKNGADEALEDAPDAPEWFEAGLALVVVARQAVVVVEVVARQGLVVHHVVTVGYAVEVAVGRNVISQI